MNKYELLQVNILDESEKEKIDKFVLSNLTNGEFINTFKYLSYHENGKFVDDSVYVVDKGSLDIKGVCIAAFKSDDVDTIISHPGTSFAGVIVSEKSDINEVREITLGIQRYYANKYKHIVMRTRPEFFSNQPMEYISYFLMNSGMKYQMIGLSNVIDLQHVHTDGDILSMFSSSKRNHYRKAIKKDLFTVVEKENVDIESWKNLSNNLLNKHNVTVVHTLDEINRLKQLFPDNISFYYAITRDNDYAAMCVVYKYKNVFHTQYLDLKYVYANEYPHYVLIYEIIKKALEEKHKKISFGISTEDDGDILNLGLYNYKAGYGGGSIVQVKFVK